MPLGLVPVRVRTQVVVFVLDVLLLPDLPVAHFHSLVVETGFFCKTADNKVDLSFQALASEVEPG